MSELLNGGKKNIQNFYDGVMGKSKVENKPDANNTATQNTNGDGWNNSFAKGLRENMRTYTIDLLDKLSQMLENNRDLLAKNGADVDSLLKGISESRPIV